MSSVDLLPSRSTLGAVLLLLHSGLASGCSWARELPPATVPPAAVAPAARAVTPPPAASLPTLTVKEPLGVPRRHWPITAGMPFPPDMLADVSRLRISAADTAFPVQGRVLSRWPNGHVRWAQLDWQVDLKPHEKRVFRVDLETLPAAPGVTISDLADRVEVNTGALQFAVPKHTFAVVANVRLDGMAVSPDPISSFLDIGGRRIAALPPSTVTISEPGPLRARIELQGHYATGFDYVIRIDAFAQQPFVRVLHTLEQHNAEPYTLVRQIALGIPTNLVGAVSYEAGLESGAPLRGRVPARGTMIGQEDNDTLVVDGVRRSAHASGWVDVRDSVRGLAIAARYFWQETHAWLARYLGS